MNLPCQSKMVFFVIISMVLLTILSGCATVTSPPDFEKIKLGMTRPEVVDALGKPDTVAASEGTEYLNYQSGRGVISGQCFGCEEYFVRLKSGKVVSFGRLGDFNSTKAPETTQNINLNTNK